jgi:glycopeptide antibiotics resistance protein
MLGALPLVAPGMVLWAAVAIVASPFISRFFAASRLHAALLLMALGLVLMATLPPTGATLAGSGSYEQACDLDRMTLAPFPELSRLNATSLNVLLFVPLGITLGSLPWSRRSLVTVAAAFLLPLAIESFQLLVPDLGRECQSADVIDNTMGLVIGLAFGASGRWLLRRARLS